MFRISGCMPSMSRILGDMPPKFRISGCMPSMSRISGDMPPMSRISGCMPSMSRISGCMPPMFRISGCMPPMFRPNYPDGGCPETSTPPLYPVQVQGVEAAPGREEGRTTS